MVVPDGGTPIRLGNIVKLGMPGSTLTTTGSLDKTEIDKKIQHPPFSLGSRPKADKIVFTAGIPPNSNAGTLSVTFQNPGADSYVLYFGTGELDMGKPFPLLVPGSFYTGALDSTNTGSVTITGAFAQVSNGAQTQRTYALRACLRGMCSAPDIKVLGGETFSFEGFPMVGEKKAALPPVCSQDPTKQDFWKSECLVGTNSGLVAYVPYDTMGDLNMYTGSTSYLTVFSGDILGNTTSLSFTGPDIIYNTGMSFVQMSNGTRGIFIDNIHSLIDSDTS